MARRSRPSQTPAVLDPRRRVVRKLFPEPWRTRYDTTDFILVDRARSHAWAETIFTGTAGVWINVAGRYPNGAVSPGAEYDRVRDEIRGGLAKLRDEQGRPVFANVWQREELYRGPFVGEAPDIVVQCAPRYGVLFESLRRELRQPEVRRVRGARVHRHARSGRVVPRRRAVRSRRSAGAPRIRSRRSRRRRSIALDVPIPRDVEAPLMDATVDPAHLAAHPPAYQDPMAEGPAGSEGGWRSGEDEEQVADHLRALGYLE